MQIKKSPRETGYQEHSRYENANYGSDSSDQFSAEEAFSPRPVRAAAREQQNEGDRTQQQPTRSESVIDRHSSFDGRFETEQDLKVEGTISGEVICRGQFTVEREATARSRVQARDAHIHGRFEGDIVCTGKLLLAATAHVTGTFKAAVLVVEEGATVSGTVDTTQQTAAPARATAPAAAAEAAPAREPSTVSRARRDLPSFAIVASDERAAGDRN